MRLGKYDCLTLKMIEIFKMVVNHYISFNYVLITAKDYFAAS